MGPDFELLHLILMKGFAADIDALKADGWIVETPAPHIDVDYHNNEITRLRGELRALNTKETR